MIAGQCVCGAVRWELDGDTSIAVHCHCSMCRRHHGTSFATMAVGSARQFRWMAGESDVQMYASSAQGRRYFCRHCGSKVPGLVPDADMAFILPGQIDGDPGFRPQLHIFAGSRAPWYTITDGLPQHETYPPGWGEGGVAQPPANAPVRADGGQSGHCLCGDVAFELHAPPLRMFNCHCSRCRRSRGGPYATNVFYPLAALHWLRGREKLRDFPLPGAKFFGTSFCARCGSLMPRESPQRAMVMVPVGSLDGDPGMRPMANIFVGSKAAWFDITDDIPQCETMPA